MKFYPCNGTVEECFKSIVGHSPECKTVAVMEVSGDDGEGNPSYARTDCSPNSVPEQFVGRQCDKLGDPETGGLYYLYLK